MNQVITLLMTLVVASMFLVVGTYVYGKMSLSIRQTLDCGSNETVTFTNNTPYTMGYWPIENIGNSYVPVITNSTGTRFPQDRVILGEKTITIQTVNQTPTLTWQVYYWYETIVCANTTTGLLGYNTMQSIDTNTYSGLNLGSIAPIALAASAIIFIVIIAFAFRD